jgi:hypothetical protein
VPALAAGVLEERHTGNEMQETGGGDNPRPGRAARLCRDERSGAARRSGGDRPALSLVPEVVAGAADEPPATLRSSCLACGRRCAARWACRRLRAGRVRIG